MIWTNCSSNIIFTRCDCNIPLFFCAVGNIAGHCSTVIWFLVLVPQVFRNFRHKSVEGISVGWAILNFTAALNNAFFIFILGNMPWYTYVSAVYMPLLEGLLLIQFVVYGNMSKISYVVAGACCVVWIAIIILQIFFNISGELEWLSIALWSAETAPQIFLNLRRRSTRGLSNVSIAITVMGKITDFAENYLLIMPLQYVVMAFFSSSIAELGAAQVVWYYNQRPMKDPDGRELQDLVERKPISKGCNILRFLGLGFFAVLLTVYAVAFVIRTRALWTIAVPIALYLMFIGYFAFLQCMRYRRRRIECRKSSWTERQEKKQSEGAESVRHSLDTEAWK